MDFRDEHLDLTYYEGSSLLQLRRPADARPFLIEALHVLTADHVKARAIVLLLIASTYVQEHEIEEACRLADEALSLPNPQRIGPILQRAHDLRQQLEPWHTLPTVIALDQRLHAMTTRST